MKKQTDAERVANVIIARALIANDGDKLGSIQSLQDELGLGIGSVTRGLDLVDRTYTGIDRKKGPNGGYFRRGPVEARSAIREPLEELEDLFRARLRDDERGLAIIKSLRAQAAPVPPAD